MAGTYKVRMHSHSTQALYLSTTGRELWIALETATFKLHFLVVLRIGEKEIERHLFVLFHAM